MGIYPKVNVIARLEFKFAYQDSEVQSFNHYTTRTLPSKFFEFLKILFTFLSTIHRYIDRLRFFLEFLFFPSTLITISITNILKNQDMKVILSILNIANISFNTKEIDWRYLKVFFIIPSIPNMINTNIIFTLQNILSCWARTWRNHYSEIPNVIIFVCKLVLRIWILGITRKFALKIIHFSRDIANQHPLAKLAIMCRGDERQNAELIKQKKWEKKSVK